MSEWWFNAVSATEAIFTARRRSSSNYVSYSTWASLFSLGYISSFLRHCDLIPTNIWKQKILFICTDSNIGLISLLRHSLV